ncbi:hypothetical protein R2601_03743 [Salipiger bermudensis HTCC2601]|uniref:Uncharacterized protein n=1 Tax=Salipiger bermudensis (strain DSM 26914 / JCM 13377 / KCTC 12554 / HTCC2601) TaxID=314265 RepID=Q0FW97_SALBH|nr:hypothetical protein R2601_03743 [Salipiger bermudensis HTCC2601]
MVKWPWLETQSCELPSVSYSATQACGSI